MRQLAQQFSCSVVLKGADSLCATRDGKLYMNKTGNPRMSSAGMGDVLMNATCASICADKSRTASVMRAGKSGGA